MIIKEFKKENQQFIEISNNNTKALINLDFGASLQELFFDGKKIIENQNSLFKQRYSSALLFPFVNRINDGKYSFNNKEYQFDCNEPERNNALHGLVFDKKFTCIDKKSDDYSATLVLGYNETQRIKAFPFTYNVQLQYIFTDAKLELKMNIKNTGTNAFPFTIGWHPYFYSSDLSESKLTFDADKKVIHNKKMITESIENYTSDKNLELKNLDDCFHLTNNTINFKTPEYDLEMTSGSADCYLQIYTPANSNNIAIEPLTGISDSFNNKEGLQILQPNKVYSDIWKIELKKQLE